MVKSSTYLLFHIFIILFLGAVTGVLSNTFSDTPIPWIRPSKDAQKQQWKQITIQEARKSLETGAVLFIDARESKEYKLGHIPGALNIPAETFLESYQEYTNWLPVDLPLIVYCQGDPCDESRTALTHLKNFGHENLLLLPGGWLEWKGAGFELER